MSILVTGHRGKLGSRLVARPGFDWKGFDTLDGHSICDEVDVSQYMEGCDAVVHLAGIPGPIQGPAWHDFVQTNVIGTYRVAEAAVATNTKRLIFASSLAFYGVEDGIPFCPPLNEGSPPIMAYLKPANLGCFDEVLRYGQSKVTAEAILAYYGLAKKLDVICLRFGALGLMTSLDLAVAAIVAALTLPAPVGYEVFNIVNDDFCSWVQNGKAKHALPIPEGTWI